MRGRKHRQDAWPIEMRSLRLQPIALLVLCICRAVQAKTSAYNLTESSTLNLTAINQHGGRACKEPGSCTFANVTVKANSLVHLCGFDATYKIRYTWTSKRQLQTFLIRDRVLEKCDIKAFDSCNLMQSTKCSKVTECTKGRYGTVFGGKVCFAIANNRNTSSWINFKVDSTFDKSLAGGRAACVLFTTAVVLLLLEPLLRPLLPHMKAALGKKPQA